MPQDAPPNGSAQDQGPGPWSRVAGMQAKLHRWAVADPGRRFDDLFNLVHDPATLLLAFDRVAGNKGANAPGVDGVTAAWVEHEVGVPGFLDDLRAALKDGSFRPLPVRERLIPKPGGSGKLRKLGIPRIADGPRCLMSCSRTPTSFISSSRAWTESTTLTTRSMPRWLSATTGRRRGLRTSRTCSRETSEGVSAGRQRPGQAQAGCRRPSSARPC